MTTFSPRRWGRTGSILVVAMTPVVAFHRALWGGRTLLYADAVEYFLPIYRVVARTWLSGEVPVWNRYAFSGYPLLGSSQAGVFYLPHLLYGLIDPRRAHVFLYVAHLVVGGLGARAFARRLWGHQLAAAATGVAYSLNAFAIGHMPHNSVWAGFAFLPWALLAIDHVVERPRPVPAAAGAAALAMVAFGGHPQAFWISASACAMYGALRAFSDRSVPVVRALTGVAGAAGTVLLGAGLGAIQLLPVSLYSQESGRPRLSLNEAMTYAYPRSHLPLLAFPYVFGSTARVTPYTDDYRGIWLNRELAGYLGMAALVLIAAGLPLIWRRPGGRALLLLFPVQLLLVLGSATPLGPWLFRTLPFFDRFRAWGRHVLVLDIIAAVLAGAGARMLVTGTRTMRMAALWRAVAALAAMGVVGLLVPRASTLKPYLAAAPVRTLAIVVPLLAGAGVVAALALSLVDRRVAGLLVLMVLAADGWSFASAYEWRAFTLSSQDAQAYVDDSPMLFGPVYDAPGGIDRFGTDAPLLQMTWVGKRLLSINGYDPLYPLEYAVAVGDMVEYGGLRRADLWTTSPVIADLLRLTTFVAQAGTTSPPPGPSAEWANRGQVGASVLTRYERAPRLPEVFLVGSARQANFVEVVSALRSDPTLDPAALVAFEGDCPQCPVGQQPGAAGPAPRATWGERRVSFEARADRAAVAVVSQAYFTGWKAKVDGRRVPVVRIYGLVTGVPVPAGTHRVELVYEAPGLRSGSLISATCTALILGALIFSALMGSRRRSQTQSLELVSSTSTAHVTSASDST